MEVKHKNVIELLSREHFQRFTWVDTLQEEELKVFGCLVKRSAYFDFFLIVRGTPCELKQLATLLATRKSKILR